MNVLKKLHGNGVQSWHFREATWQVTVPRGQIAALKQSSLIFHSSNGLSSVVQCDHLINGNLFKESVRGEAGGQGWLRSQKSLGVILWGS